jgi:hypothetical protein
MLQHSCKIASGPTLWFTFQRQASSTYYVSCPVQHSIAILQSITAITIISETDCMCTYMYDPQLELHVHVHMLYMWAQLLRSVWLTIFRPWRSVGRWYLVFCQTPPSRSGRGLSPPATSKTAFYHSRETQPKNKKCVHKIIHSINLQSRRSNE